MAQNFHSHDSTPARRKEKGPKRNKSTPSPPSFYVTG